MTETVRQLLDAQDWDDHYKRLTLYAQRLLRVRSWRGVTEALVPGGNEDCDFALEAIEAIYTGTRKWDPEKHPNLGLHLQWVVRSLISNAVTGQANKREVRLADLLESDEPGSEKAEKWAWGFLAQLEAEPELYRIVEAIIDGVIGRQEIAAYLGITPEQISNARKQLQRRLDGYLETTSGQPRRRGEQK